MSLRRKVALVLFLAVATFVGGDNYLHRKNFEHRFRQLDNEQAKRHLNAAGLELRALSDRLEVTAQQLTNTLGTRSVALSDLLEAAVQPGSPEVLLAFDQGGWVKFHRIRHPATGEPIKVQELPNERLSENHLLRLNGASTAGILNTKAGPLLIGSAVAPETAQGPIHLLVGRFLTTELQKELSFHRSIGVEVLLAQSLLSEPDSAALLDSMLSNPEGYALAEDAVSVHASKLVTDIVDAPVLALSVSVPKTMLSLWGELREYSVLSMVALSFLCPLVLLLLLQWIVTGPLRKLTQHTVMVGKGQENGTRLNLARKDEIGRLASEFDSMLDQLEQSRQELIHTARLAGMSDVSSGVMHNVGNLLNHVAVTANLSRDSAKELPVGDLLAMAAALPREPEAMQRFLTEDARGKHLPWFLSEIAQSVHDHSLSLQEEAASVSEGIGEIAKLIAILQDSDARTGVIEAVDLGAQVASIADLCAMSVEEGQRIQVVKDIQVSGRFPLDRHKLKEVLMNVIRNGMESVLLAKTTKPQLSIVVREISPTALAIEVADNGLGIDSRDLTRVFAAGYSLKPERQGLGLHLASTAAIEMGGKLEAESAGLGLGAVFRLVVPMAKRAVAA